MVDTTATTERSERETSSDNKPSPALDLQRFFVRQVGRIAMLTKKFKRKRSQQQPQPPESARTEILPKDLLREIQMDSPYNEHTMTLEQLVDIYPLSRIDAQNPSKSRGLNDDEALTKLSGGRRNVVRPLTWRSSRIRMFLAQFRNTFRLLLLIAAIVCILVFLLDHSRTTELAMAIVLITVLFLMCIVSYYEEKKTAKQISGFQNMIPVETTVIRQGRELCVAATDLVIGDLVWIRRGDRIPADLRIIFAEELNLETSWITGEVEPLEYSSEPVPKGIGVFESQDIAFNGCSCTSGQGIGLVIRIGSDTLIGKLVEVTTREKTRNSRLEVEHVRFVRFITIIALIMATVTFIIGLCINGFTHFVNTLINGFLVVIIANVPQGLPVTLTAQLIIVARRLSKLGLYLKRLDLADTLGMTSVLMTDKTGVLTSNDLRVTDLWCQQMFYSTQDLVEKKTMSAESADRRSESGVVQDSGSVSDTSSSSSGPPIPGMDNSLAVMTTVMCVCDKARIDSSPHQTSVLVGSKTPSFRRRRSKNMFYGQKVGDLVPQAKGKQQARVSLSDSAFSLRHKDLKEKSVVGKATDVALIKFVEKFTSAERLRDQYEIVYEVPFSAYRRYHLVITSDRRNRLADDDEVITYTLMVKGAPEELIRNCDTIVTENGAEDLSEDLLVEFEKAYLRFGEEGKSCLAFAMLEFDDFADTEFFWDAEEPNFPDSGWCFLGMAAMYDPPRPHINEVVRKSERAGIRLFMVTGDHPTTAEAVARQIGFCTPCKFPVLGPSSSASDVSSSTDSNSVETLGHAEAGQSEAGVQNIGTEELEVIHGDSLKHFTAAELERVVRRRHVVFARTTPAQKTELVKACQETRDIVTLTGDGLMDAPALKQADVGIAMEAIGSVFAKEASDIVIIENDLANIVKGIEEARLLFDNLKKTIAYTLSHLLPEMLPVLLQFILGFPLGLSSLQVLTVDLITEIPPSIALIFEPAERDIMKRPPRKQQSRLVTPSLLAYSYVFAGNIISLGCLFAYFTVFWVHGFSISDLVHTAQHYWKEGAENLTSSSAEVFTDVEQVLIHQEASAAWHITLVMSQVLHLWMCTTRRVSLFRHGIRNWVLVAAVVFEVLVLVFLIFTPGLGHFLGVRPPPSIIWLFPFGVGLVLLIFNEVRKFFIRHDPRNPIVRLVKW